MKRSSSPWVFFLLVLLIVAAGIGAMEYLRRGEQAKVDLLAKQIQEANTRAQSVKAREEKLKVNQARRKEIEGRLLDAKAGNLYAQDLMAMVGASRLSAAKMPQVGFNAQAMGSITTMGISTSVTGSEEQALQFIRLLEEGRPVTQVNNVGWNIPIENGGSGGSGGVTLSLTLYGPLNLPASPPSKPQTPSTTKP